MVGYRYQIFVRNESHKNYVLLGLCASIHEWAPPSHPFRACEGFLLLSKDPHMVDTMQLHLFSLSIRH
jgi:hypothetical protein